MDTFRGVTFQGLTIHTFRQVGEPSARDGYVSRERREKTDSTPFSCSCLVSRIRVEGFRFLLPACAPQNSIKQFSTNLHNVTEGFRGQFAETASSDMVVMRRRFPWVNLRGRSLWLCTAGVSALREARPPALLVINQRRERNGPVDPSARKWWASLVGEGHRTRSPPTAAGFVAIMARHTRATQFQ